MHGNYKGDNVKDQSGRARAERAYTDLGTCEHCGEKPAVDRHHVDGDPLNNERENLEFLCRKCHMIADGRTRGGINWNVSRRRWLVSARKDGKSVWIGTFKTEQEAQEALDKYNCDDPLLK